MHEAEDIKKDEIHMYLDDNRCYFISAERLGLIESNVSKMAYTSGKRKRAIEFNAIAHVLKSLKIVDREVDIKGIAYGCLDTGEAGMFIICRVPTKIHGTVPEAEAKAGPA